MISICFPLRVYGRLSSQGYVAQCFPAATSSKDTVSWPNASLRAQIPLFIWIYHPRRQQNGLLISQITAHLPREPSRTSCRNGTS